MKLSHNSIYLKYILFKFKIYFSILFGKKINFLNKLYIIFLYITTKNSEI